MHLLRTLRKKTRAHRLQTFRNFAGDVRKAIGVDGHLLKIMDIGGTVAFWEEWWGITEEDRFRITLINTHEIDVSCKAQVTTRNFIDEIDRDATTLDEAEMRRYDMVFSNSCLEHLRSWKEIKALAERIVESRLPYFIQVPNKHSPIDPHHPFAPFFSLYPKSMRVRLLTLSTFGNGKRVPLKAAQIWQDYYNPLGFGDMRELFPDATLRVERPFGIPMSVLALRPASPKA